LIRVHALPFAGLASLVEELAAQVIWALVADLLAGFEVPDPELV
jgi:hypothetical protein